MLIALARELALPDPEASGTSSPKALVVASEADGFLSSLRNAASDATSPPAPGEKVAGKEIEDGLTLFGELPVYSLSDPLGTLAKDNRCLDFSNRAGSGSSGSL